MVRIFPILLATLALSACATAIDRSTQEVTIETPGTTGALCFLERPGFRARVWAPKTLRINKSGDPLVVTCHAPSNRKKVVVAEAKIPASFYANVANGMLPGGLWDYESGAMFKYPEKITVDFTGMLPQPMPGPDYQRVLDENPAIFDMEEFRPGVPALQRDRDYKPTDLQFRRTNAELFSSTYASPDESFSAGSTDGTGGLNTSTETSDSSSGGPMQILPPQ